jgi:hypothetical protein
MAYTTINKSTDYFNTKLYTGNGGANSITGVGFQPDFVWMKNRSTTLHHVLQDAVRGTTKAIYSNLTAAEETQSGSITAFDSDGFTFGSGTMADVNGNGNSFVSWNWKANGSGSANTDGSITSTVSASAASGFSVVSWTGTGANATVGHGLTTAPKMVFYKNRTDVTHWYCITTAIDGSVDLLHLNLTDAKADISYTAPTNSLLNLTSINDTNGSGDNIIAYCFAEKTGYSKFGSYTGNGNSDGTFVYTGFKPAFLMVKNISTTDDWRMFDNRRPGMNVIDDELKANTSGAEGAGDKMDFLSNGVKFRVSTAVNASNTYIYMAFGQSLVGSNNIPCTAR